MAERTSSISKSFIEPADRLGALSTQEVTVSMCPFGTNYFPEFGTWGATNLRDLSRFELPIADVYSKGYT